MVSLLLADDLLQAARAASSPPDVREAIRGLALEALGARHLTVSHMGTVLRVLGEGIRGCTLMSSVPVRDTQRAAWQGLGESLGHALYAWELALADLDGEGAHFPMPEREATAQEFERLLESLAAGFADERLLEQELGPRIIALAAGLRDASTGAKAITASDTIADARLLAFMATGVLLGLKAVPRGGPGR